MANQKCPTCSKKAAGRNIFCSDCWSRIPLTVREDVRKGAEKGSNTLKAQPSKEWLSRAIKYASASSTAPSAVN